MATAQEQVVDTLRGRVLRGLQAGTLRAGDRLPASREAAAELGVDYRFVIAAYKALEAEGLIELRPRGGVYVAHEGASGNGTPPLPESWLADVLTEGLNREISATALAEWLRRSVETLRLRAVTVTATSDQGYGLCRELRDDFGMESETLLEAEVRGAETLPLALRQADLLVTTEALAEWLGPIASELGKRLIVIDVRPELATGEWALLLRRPVYVLVATAEFGAMLQQYYAEVPGIENLRLVVFGRDDLAQIPADAPTYVTQSVRARLHGAKVPGKILPPARTIATHSAREILGFIVRANIEAMSRGDR